jgi:hypothetical protein
MSNYFLCARCKHCMQWVRVNEVECARRGMEIAKVMYDHGHANGRAPYDEPEDVCRDFELMETDE